MSEEQETAKQEFKGTIQFYKKNDGFGFVRPEDGKSREDDIFIHHTDLPEDIKRLKPEQVIAYDIAIHEHPTRGECYKAINIEIID